MKVFLNKFEIPSIFVIRLMVFTDGEKPFVVICCLWENELGKSNVDARLTHYVLFWMKMSEKGHEELVLDNRI